MEQSANLARRPSIIMEAEHVIRKRCAALADWNSAADYPAARVLLELGPVDKTRPPVDADGRGFARLNRRAGISGHWQLCRTLRGNKRVDRTHHQITIHLSEVG
jgi:hypothetical protein